MLAAMVAPSRSYHRLLLGPDNLSLFFPWGENQWLVWAVFLCNRYKRIETLRCCFVRVKVGSAGCLPPPRVVPQGAEGSGSPSLPFSQGCYHILLHNLATGYGQKNPRPARSCGTAGASGSSCSHWRGAAFIGRFVRLPAAKALDVLLRTRSPRCAPSHPHVSLPPTLLYVRRRF